MSVFDRVLNHKRSALYKGYRALLLENYNANTTRSIFVKKSVLPACVYIAATWISTVSISANRELRLRFRSVLRLISNCSYRITTFLQKLTSPASLQFLLQECQSSRVPFLLHKTKVKVFCVSVIM